MCYGKQGKFVLWKKSGISGYQILEYLAVINTSIMAPSTRIRLFFKTDFFPPFSKNTHPHVVFSNRFHLSTQKS